MYEIWCTDVQAKHYMQTYLDTFNIELLQMLQRLTEAIIKVVPVHCKILDNMILHRKPRVTNFIFTSMISRKV